MTETKDPRTIPTIQLLLANVYIAWWVVGLQFFMCFYGLVIFLETNKKARQGRAFHVAMSFVIAALYTISELPMAYLIFYLLKNNWQSAADMITLEGDIYHTWWDTGSNWLSNLLMWTGDGLLTYRCWIIWRDRFFIALLPVVLYAATIAVSVWCKVLEAMGITKIDDRVDLAWTLTLFLNASVNILVTLLVSGRLLHMHHRQSKLLQVADSKMYFGVIAILVESALPLSLVALISAITSRPTIASRYPVLYDSFYVAWPVFMALSPQMIIFRVTIGRSWSNSSQLETRLSTLAFDRRTVSSSKGLPEANEAGSIIEHDMYGQNVNLQDQQSHLSSDMSEKLSGNLKDTASRLVSEANPCV